jgi:hypothetical protein
MDNSRLLVVAMADKCRSLILQFDAPDLDLPDELQTKHLLSMCNKIEQYAEDGDASKLHRWIGFIQAAMLANRMLDSSRLKAMFDEAKCAYAGVGEDWMDHLDPTDSFECDIGGQG